MTAICGLLDLEGKAVSGRELEPMMAAQRHRGADRAGVLVRGPLALGVQQLFVTPESEHSDQPYRDPLSRLVVAGDCRLDNREEILEWLEIAEAPGGERPDEQIFLLAYRKAGDAALCKMVGEFACVVFHEPSRRLSLITDAMGTKPLHYAVAAGRVCFATEVKGVLAGPGVPRRLNQRKLALTALPLAPQLERGSTFFEGVTRVAAATVLSLDTSGRRERRYWSPEPEARSSVRSTADWLEAVRSQLHAAVFARCRSARPVAALLSGGLDSSGVVALASAQLADRGGGLKAFASVSAPENLERFLDERDFASLLVPRHGLELALVADPAAGPFDELERLVWLNDAPTSTSRHYVYCALLARAAEAGCRAVLDGALGEIGPSYTGQGILAELTAHGRVLILLRHLRRRLQLRPEPLWPLLKGEILRPLLGPFWRRVRPLGERLDLERHRGQSFLRREFLHAVLGAELPALAERVRSLFEWSPDHRRMQARAIELAQGTTGGRFPGGERVSLERPYMDRRLIETCLAAPVELKLGGGYERMLIRKSLDGLLPPAIQWRTSKLPFAPDYPARYNRDRGKALAMLEDLAPRIGEWLDVARLRRALAVEMTNNRGSTPADFAALHSVPAGLRTAVFLGSLA